MRHALSSGLILAAMGCLAIANDANYTVVGSTGSFAKSDSIQMVREDVRIYLHDEFMNVRCTFVFKNHGPATKATMAFPDESSSEGDGPSIAWLRSTVDGRPVNIERKPVASTTSSERYSNYGIVWLKDVDFKAGQTRVVTTNYRARNGIAGHASIANEYVLETGSTWRGSIEHCWVTVDWSNCRRASKPELTAYLPSAKAPVEGASANREVPLPWKAPHPRVRTLHLRDLRPNFNIAINCIKGFWNFRMNGRPMPQFLGVQVDSDGLVRRGAEIRMPLSSVPKFFGSIWNRWRGPSADWVGSGLEFEGTRTVARGDGKRLRLARPFFTVGQASDGSRVQGLYLSDLIRALGGTYRYVPDDERVDITLPP